MLNGDLGWKDVAGHVVSRAELIAAFAHGSDFGDFEDDHGAVFRETLRCLVSTWIETGRDSNGTDDPWNRKAPSELIEEFWFRNSPYVHHAEDGHIRIRFGPRHDPVDPSEWARNLAESYFVRLLDSPRRECLSSCMKCAKYFVRIRHPKRGIPTRNGSFCRWHQDYRKVRSVKDSRKMRKLRLIELAARIAVRYVEKSRREGPSEWIARNMNGEIQRHPKLYRPADPVSRKWVTQNARAITEELQRSGDLCPVFQSKR